MHDYCVFSSMSEPHNTWMKSILGGSVSVGRKGGKWGPRRSVRYCQLVPRSTFAGFHIATHRPFTAETRLYTYSITHIPSYLFFSIV